VMVASRQFEVCSAIESKQATIHLIYGVWKRARGSNMERDITLYNAIGKGRGILPVHLGRRRVEAGPLDCGLCHWACGWSSARQ
jgi:hypothetical protein